MLTFEAGKVVVVAEVAQAHDGSLGTAHAYIDAVARAGVDAVKFQAHLARAESTPAEPWRVPFSYQDRSRYDYWQRMEFSAEQWQGLRAHARVRQLAFICSPFSPEAVDLLEPFGVDAWKAASGEVGNSPLLERMTRTGVPIVLSSGMSPLEELDEAVTLVRRHARDLTVLQCSSLYPTPPEKLGLNMLDLLRRRYACRVGLSDHSGTVFAGLAAAALGCELLEVHVTFSREAFGPDVPASLTLPELAQLVEGVRFIERANSHPVDKDHLAEDLSDLRRMFTHSLVARTDLKAGLRLERGHLALKKPGFGLPASRMSEVEGRLLRRAVAADQALSLEDLE